jgi:hypothetical protein
MTDPGGLQAGDWYKQPFVSPDGNDISNIRHPGWKPVDFYRVHDAGDGYRYYVTPGGWTQLGKTEDLIEDDISDLQSVKIGLMRMANGPFNMPLDPNNPFTTPSIRQLTGFQPFSDEEVNTKTWRDWGIATCTELGVGLLTSEIGGEAADEAEVASFAGRNPFSSVETYETGSFSIRDWTGYPEGYPKPSNPVRIVSGEEYETNFALKKVANRDLHIENPSWKGFHIHEIQPIKFGGDPVDPANKILLLPEEHYRFNAFWNRLQRSIEKK